MCVKNKICKSSVEYFDVISILHHDTATWNVAAFCLSVVLFESLVVDALGVLSSFHFMLQGRIYIYINKVAAHDALISVLMIKPGKYI